MSDIQTVGAVPDTVTIKKSDLRDKLRELHDLLASRRSAPDMGTVENMRGQISVYKAILAGDFPKKREAIVDPEMKPKAGGLYATS